MTGIGVPQYLWRETPQSFRRKMISFFPKPFDWANEAICSLACSVLRPLNSPEWMLTPYSVKGPVGDSVEIEDPCSEPDGRTPSVAGATTARIGRLYFLQNSKSRSS